jgi:hypothetical protein
MPKVEISAEHLEKIAQSIGRVALDMPMGSVERHTVERLLLRDEAMVAAFINWHLKCEDSEGQ